MSNGWYRLTHWNHDVKVQYVEQGRCNIGSVSTLMAAGWSFEEVEVLTPQELRMQVQKLAYDKLHA